MTDATTALTPTGIPVIEDAAQSFGAEYKGKKSCNLSTLGCTSFFPSKPLGCYGDGGAIFTNDDGLAQACREIRVHGQSKRYVHTRIGVGGRMDTLQCAIVLAKLDRFDQDIAQRQIVARRYHELLATEIHGITRKEEEREEPCPYPSVSFRVIPWQKIFATETHGTTRKEEREENVRVLPCDSVAKLFATETHGTTRKEEREENVRVLPCDSVARTLRLLPWPKADRTSVFAQYTILVEDRDALQARLQTAGVPTAVHYPVPLNEQPAYGHLCCPDGAPVAHAIARQVMSLPMHPDLSEAEQQRIVATLMQRQALCHTGP